MKNIKLLLYFSLCFLFQFTYGDDFRYLRTNEGLYNGEINSIAQDKSGKMWFATWTGIASYNGFDFQFFVPELGNPWSLQNKKTNTVFIDTKDNLWVATPSAVSVFRKNDETFHHVLLESTTTNGYYVFDFFESKGRILIHCNLGLFLVSESKNKDGFLTAKKLNIRYKNSEVAEYIHHMCTFQDEICLVSNLNVSAPTSLFISELIVNDRDTLIEVSNKRTTNFTINALVYAASNQKLFFGTSDGVSSFSLKDLQFLDERFLKGTNINDLLLSSEQKIYCYSHEPVLIYIDLKTSSIGKYLPNPLKFGTLLDNNITCLFEDFSGNLWVGHQGLGLSILNLNRKAFYSYKRDPSRQSSLSGNIVMCFNDDGKDILIGLRQGGLNVCSKQIKQGETVEFKTIPYQQSALKNSEFNSIWNIARESDSVFWVASNGGLCKLRRTEKGWQYGKIGEKPLYEGVVRKILVDKDKNIWVGTFNEGLIFIPALHRNPTHKSFNFPYNPNNLQGISDKTVLSMIIDSKDRFWVGTNKGINLLKTPYSKLDLTGEKAPTVTFNQIIAENPQKDFLNANEINCIFENQDGSILLATQGGGLNLLDADAMKFSHYTTENGLSGNDVFGIVSDRNGIKWISTNVGIVAFDENNKIKPFTYYHYSDGLQGETFKVNSYHQSADGEIFFGGDNGFTRFYPEKIKFNPIPPKVAFTNFKIANRTVSIGDTISSGNVMTMVLDEMTEIKLPFDKNSFSVGVGVHHYQFPAGNMIRYKLDGFNDRWITLLASNQNIYFSKVPYGTYTLHVSALSADNVLAENERTLIIRILPPWYKTWYFQFFVALVLILLAGLIIKWFVVNQRAKFQKKIDKIELENNENKMRFLTNIAHELRTPLSLVIAPIEDLKQNYTTIDPKWKNHLNLIYRNSNYLLTLINQIIDFRKLNAGKLQLSLEHTDIVQLINDVVENFKGLESRKKTNLQVVLPPESILVEVDHQKIEEVMYNLLSNAFKHTKENLSIIVSLKVIESAVSQALPTKKTVRISVFNEGKDISDEDKIRIFERFYKVNEKVEGAGIGLSFSKSLVEMHGGSIWVESIENKGVSFHIDLTFDEIEITELPEARASAEKLWHEEVFDYKEVHVLENKGKDLSIVIVEDNIDLRSFLKNTLSSNYECYESGNGVEGYELVCQIVPDIVISDVIMPKMDGYELCEKLKGNVKTCHIPIILLTANNASDHIMSGYEKGADAYVTKPFDMNIIKSQISRLIKNRELIREKYLTQNFMVEVTSSSLSKDDEFILRLRELLETNLSETDFNVKKLSEDLNISTTHLYRKLKALTGLSPVEFIRTFKLQKACEMLSTTNYSIKEIGYGLGFNNLSYFVKCFREQFGVTPSSYRKNGLSEEVKK